MTASPRILITGFGPFPGVPVNPTQRLAGALAAHPPTGEGVSAFRAEVLDVAYASLPLDLARLGREFDPEIAIHFGVAKECRGFRLERVARNAVLPDRPDQSGSMPPAVTVCAGPEMLASRLPLESIAASLEAAGLPVEWSDDAGGYLCNAIMMLSLSHACEGFAPRMSGFVHVPPIKEDVPGAPLSFDALLAGARVVIDSCARAWRA